MKSTTENFDELLIASSFGHSRLHWTGYGIDRLKV